MVEIDYDSSTLFLEDEFGPAPLIDAKGVRDALRELRGPIRVSLNSPGGAVDTGVAIFNMLASYPHTVTTVVNGVAASMASYVMQAGDVRQLGENSVVMLHQPWSLAVGNSGELRKQADILDVYFERMLPVYSQRSGRPIEELRELLEEEVWYSGEEASAAGFADSLATEFYSEPIAPAAKSRYFPKLRRAKALRAIAACDVA